MRSLIVSFAAGTAFLQIQPDLPALNLFWLLLPLALIALPAFPTGHGATGALRMAVASALCFGIGFAWAAWCAANRLADTLPPAWEGADIRVVGVVAQLPQVNERSQRFEFDVERVLTPLAAVPAHISLSWWGSPPADGAAGSVPALHPGERWELTVRLRRPHGLQNPNGFDYEAWLLERNIRATGYVRAPATARRVTALVTQPRYLVERMREAARTRIANALPEAPFAGVLIALAIGEQRAISPAQWQVFTRTGVNHLMSISGLHVTMIAGLAFWLAHLLWSCSPNLLLRLPARKAAAAAGLLAACAYAWLAGFAVPAQRTVYMLAVVAAALWNGRLISPGTILCAALLLVVVIDPWAALSAGFWLSFGAVGVILMVTSYRIGKPHWLVAWGRVQWAITLALAPVLVALFQQISVISPLANALAIPVVSLAVVPMTLLGIFLPGSLVLQAAHALMAACCEALEWLSGFPAAVWQQHAPPMWTVLVALAGIAWMLLPRGFPARWIGVFAVMPLFAVVPALLPEATLRVAVLDIGQGLAIAVQTRNHALLFDAGTTYGADADSGSRVIVPYLRASGIFALDVMIISHGDKDHSGGAASVIAATPIQRVLTSVGTTDTAHPAWPAADRCIAGEHWQWDGVTFEILHPHAEHYARSVLRSNDRSCVLRATVGAVSILFSADIEKKTELELMRRAADKLPSQVLLAPHHGSRTSSTAEFLAAVRPDHVIVAAGYRNRFGHPKDDVVERYRALGSRIYRTDLDGAVIVTMAAGDVDIRRQRAAERRYWHSVLENPDVPDEEEFLRVD